MKPKLPLHEWLAVWTILSGIAILTLISSVFNRNPVDASYHPPHLLVDENIEIMVEGAVEMPGSYLVKRGSTMAQVLELVKPLPEANLRRIKWHAKVRDGQFIHIPSFQMITVFLEGHVKTAGPIKVRKGTKINELEKMVEWPQNVDLRPLNKKRNLKDQEVIHIKERV